MFKCNEKGHIARFCKANNAEYKTASLKVSAAVQQVKLLKRLFLKVNILEKELMLLHDTGSQFLIITRDDYDRLPTKSPLQQVEQSGVGINVSNFAFDGMVYLKLDLSNEEGETFKLPCNQCSFRHKYHLIILVSIQRKTLHHVVAILRTIS